MGLINKIFSRTQKEKDENLTINFERVPYPMTADKEKFLQIITSTGYGALAINLRDYTNTLQFLADNISQKFGHDSGIYDAIIKDTVLCSNCGTNLTFRMAMNMVYGTIPARCEQCGSEMGYYIFDSVPSGNITEEDIALIRKYQRSLAQDWWTSNPNVRQITCNGLECDVFGKSMAAREIKRDAGYYTKSGIECEKCYNKRIAMSVPYLQAYPNYMGTGMVRRARVAYKKDN